MSMTHTPSRRLLLTTEVVRLTKCSLTVAYSSNIHRPVKSTLTVYCLRCGDKIAPHGWTTDKVVLVYTMKAFLNLALNSVWVVYFMVPTLSPSGKQWMRGWVDPRAATWVVNRKIFFSLPGIRPTAQSPSSKPFHSSETAILISAA
jgi:hypothetical protein